MGLFSLFSRADADKPINQSAIRAKPDFQYRGVEVIPDPRKCCTSVKALAGRRLLAHEAPQLPMPGCDQPSCECRFQQYDDRRTDIRRDADVGISTILENYVDNARAGRSGRRSDDHDSD